MASKQVKKEAKKIAKAVKADVAGANSTAVRRASKQRAKRAAKRAIAIAEGAELGFSAQDNPYLATLQDPEMVRGVKVPDPISFPSSTWDCEVDGTLLADSTGSCLVVVDPMNAVNSGVSTAGYGIITRSNSAGGGDSAGFGTVGVPLVSQANPSLFSIMQSLRPVSGYIKAYATSSPLNTTGRAVGFMLPRGWASAAAMTSFSQFVNLPFAWTDHALKGAKSGYIPADALEFNYGQLFNSAASQQVGFSSGSLLNIGTAGSAFGVAFTGLPSGTTVAFRIVVNYEFLPSSDTVGFLNATPSPSQPGWIQAANNWITKYGETLMKPAADIGLAALNVVLPGASAAGGAVRGAFDFAQRYLGPKTTLTSMRPESRLPY